MALTETVQPRGADAPHATGAPSVLVVLVTHQGRRWLKDCLVSLNAQTHPALDVLVVDDASPDFRTEPHLKRVTKRHLRRRRWAYLRTPRALGFGGAVNWALSRVRTSADLLLFLHDDTVLDDTCIESMVARMQAEETTAIVGPKIVAWDEPARLEEVGMAADRFGYPYKGLEEGEIDLGQHDVPAEVFFVSSTCMLMRPEVFRELRGFDSRMRVFAEDLDLCWRARLAGHQVRVEPLARVRHAIALAKGERRSPFVPPRYFIRRNRLRTVAKNASTIRLVALIPQFMLLTLAEMLGFIVLRQPGEIFNLARAVGWNLLSLPQTLSERARVQRMRRIPDRRLRRYTVRQSKRLHFYVEHQAGRLEEAWGRRAELLAVGTKEARALGARLKGWPAVVGIAALIGLLLGLRYFLWGPSAAIGELLPYPERATGLWRAFVSPWRAAGLGEPGSAPPAFALLGSVPFTTLGLGSPQKLLVLGLIVVSFIGVYRLVADLVDRPARYAAGLVYALGGVGYASMRAGELSALVFGAVAPFVVLFVVRLTGWVRPPGWSRSRAVARLGFASAISAAFVPGSLVLYGLVAAVLAGARATFDRTAKATAGLAATGAGLFIGWVLLLPWSATWFQRGGALARLFTDGETYAAAFGGHGMASVLLGQTPSVPPLFGLALPLMGLIAVLTARAQRRRLAFAFWGIIVLVGWIVTATRGGMVPPVVASPTQASVLAALAFASLLGLAIGAFRLDLPRRGLGRMHALTITGLAVSAFLAASGILPALWHGEWFGRASQQRNGSEVVAQVGAFLQAEAGDLGPFRALWIGDSWQPPAPTTARPTHDYLLTGPRGPVLSDLFTNAIGPGDQQLARALASIEGGATDAGGSLLGAFNIDFVVLDKADSIEPWLTQRDLAVVRTEPQYVLLANEASLPRAAVYPRVPGYLAALQSNDPAALAEPRVSARGSVQVESAHTYRVTDASGPGVVFFAESRDEGWTASFEGRALAPEEAGWASAFALPADRGTVTFSYRWAVDQIIVLLGVALLWGIVVAAAFSTRERTLRKEGE